MLKADYWSDGWLWSKSALFRDFYQGLWALAEDSGILENKPLDIQVALPFKITEGQIKDFIKELIKEKKLISFNEKYFFLVNFHKHQGLTRSVKPKTPIPAWLTWEPYPSNNRLGKFVVNEEKFNSVTVCNETVTECNETVNHDKEVEVEVDKEESISHCPKPDRNFFEEFCKIYPGSISKTATLKNWKRRIKEGYKPETLIQTAERYSAECKKSGKTEYLYHAHNFLGDKAFFEKYLQDDVSQKTQADLIYEKIERQERERREKKEREENASSQGILTK